MLPPLSSPLYKERKRNTREILWLLERQGLLYDMYYMLYIGQICHNRYGKERTVLEITKLYPRNLLELVG